MFLITNKKPLRTFPHILRKTFLLLLLLLGVESVAYDVAFLSPGENAYWQVWLLNTSNGKTKQISHSAYDKNRISWHSKGKKLLVNGQQGELVWLDVRTTREQAIKTPLQGFSDAHLSPDNQHIAFSLSTSESKNDNNIWLYHLTNKKLKKLTNLPELQHQPVWGKNKIYFLSGSGGDTHDIWSVDTKTDNAQQLTQNTLYHFDIAVSPTGKLAFSSNLHGQYDIWQADANVQHRQRLTEDLTPESSPSWSPDGRYLVYDRMDKGVSNLWLMDLKSKKVRQLTQRKYGTMRPVWFHGGGR